MSVMCCDLNITSSFCRHLGMEMFLSDSDCDSSSESSCSDFLDDIDSMYGGQAQSILSNLERSIGRIDDFLSFERGFIHGDVVCYAKDPSGQLGRVVDVDIVVDLETFHGELVKDINCKKLLKVCPFVVGDYVVNGPWLGRVSRVFDRLTILFDDGAKCEVTATNPEDIRPLCPSVVEDPQYPYYPGQRVQIRMLRIFKSAKWLSGGWKESPAEGTVCQVEAGIVNVDWVASAMIGCSMNVTAPPCVQESKDLTLLSCFTHANWQLGDWCLLPVDQSIVKEKVLNVYSMEHISEENKSKRGLVQGNHKSDYEDIYTIVKKKTKVDVVWQDGTRSFGLESQSILTVNSVGDHEFWPEQFVAEKSSSDDPHLDSVQRSAIVKTVDAKERTVILKWKTHAENKRNDSDEKCSEETVSAYELIEHPDYSYCLGDIVFRLRMTLSDIQTNGQSEYEGPLTTEMRKCSVKQHEEDYNISKPASEISWKYQNKCYLSCIGNVIGFEDEGVIVRWAGGSLSKVEPWEIVGIDKHEDPVAAPVIHAEDTVDKLSRELPEHDKEFTLGKDKDVLDRAGNSVGRDNNKDIWESGPSFLPRAAIGFFKNIAESFFGSHGSSSLSPSIESSPLKKLDSDQQPSATVNDIESLHEKDATKYHNMSSVSLSAMDGLQVNMKLCIGEHGEKNGPCDSPTSENQGIFKQFDTVTDLPDHYFIQSDGKTSMSPQLKRGWLKKVQEEWSLLERDLPDSIYVRVCEERIDLLRAAIVGAPGTPYHDGLFFFDFFLPPDYPFEPPVVHYHSGGLRLNPNLYESGKICLSLLNTWMGTGTEAWNPKTSTILQVLLSLQALVLNERPYFNEAGYDAQMGKAEGEKNSVTYNENTFLLSCKSMLYILSKPPKCFEELVEEHFQGRSHSILLACKAYMDGAPVGSAFDGGTDAQEAQKSSSTGFKIMLDKLFPKLISCFIDKGIECSQFL